MAISYYLNIASPGRCLPMATDLVLNEDPEPEATQRDGFRLGQVVATDCIAHCIAWRYNLS
jgi:hypothetical protein